MAGNKIDALKPKLGIRCNTMGKINEVARFNYPITISEDRCFGYADGGGIHAVSGGDGRTREVRSGIGKTNRFSVSSLFSPSRVELEGLMIVLNTFRAIAGEPCTITPTDVTSTATTVDTKTGEVRVPKWLLKSADSKDRLALAFIAAHEAMHMRLDHRGDLLFYADEVERVCDIIAFLQIIRAPVYRDQLFQHPELWGDWIQIWTGAKAGHPRYDTLFALLDTTMKGALEDLNPDDVRRNIRTVLATRAPFVAQISSTSRIYQFLERMMSSAIDNLLAPSPSEVEASPLKER